MARKRGQQAATKTLPWASPWLFNRGLTAQMTQLLHPNLWVQQLRHFLAELNQKKIQSDGGDASLSGADAHNFLYGHHPYLAVARVSGIGATNYDVHQIPRHFI